MTEIVLPWPPSSLSGHAKGHWRGKADVTAQHRLWANYATLSVESPPLPPTGDIRIVITFYPPDQRGDRTNFANRIKPYFDGIAEALKVNDKRFLPEYRFEAPMKPGKVVFTIG